MAAPSLPDASVIEGLYQATKVGHAAVRNESMIGINLAAKASASALRMPVPPVPP